MKSRMTPTTTSIGVGDFRVDQDTDFATNIEVLRKVNLGRKMLDKGVGDGDVFAELGPPVLIKERDVSTEQSTELKEKEIKTVFLSGGAATQAVIGGPAVKPVKTRSIGVGDSKVFDVSESTESSLQVSTGQTQTVGI